MCCSLNGACRCTTLKFRHFELCLRYIETALVLGTSYSSVDERLVVFTKVALFLTYRQYVDVSSTTVKERLVQRLVVVEVDESRKLLESHVAVAVCVHFLHQ